MSVTWVERLILASSRCERSPNPVSVGANTLCPRFSNRSDTRRQHHPPCHAPCTRRKVFGGVWAWANAVGLASAAAPTPVALIAERRVTEIFVFEVMAALPLTRMLGLRPL